MEIKDTKEIQLDSLDMFMEALGYSRDWSYANLDFSYRSLWGMNRNCPLISFNTAAKLHNGAYCWWEWNGKSKLEKPFDFFNIYLLTKAHSAKIVKTVKLQYSKKKNEIKVMSHVVSFVKPEYYDLFLGG